MIYMDRRWRFVQYDGAVYLHITIEGIEHSECMIPLADMEASIAQHHALQTPAPAPATVSLPTRKPGRTRKAPEPLVLAPPKRKPVVPKKGA
jgi:hypothetical protein